jgi:hypothetical protein
MSTNCDIGLRFFLSRLTSGKWRHLWFPTYLTCYTLTTDCNYCHSQYYDSHSDWQGRRSRRGQWGPDPPLFEVGSQHTNGPPLFVDKNINGRLNLIQPIFTMFLSSNFYFLIFSGFFFNFHSSFSTTKRLPTVASVCPLNTFVQQFQTSENLAAKHNVTGKAELGRSVSFSQRYLGSFERGCDRAWFYHSFGDS